LFSLKHGAVNRHNQAIQSEDSARFLINDLTEQVITLRSAGWSMFFGSWFFCTPDFCWFSSQRRRRWEKALSPRSNRHQ